MGNVTDVLQEKGLYFIRITRNNGSSYRVVSVDKKSMEEYREEFLKARAERLARGK